MREGRKFSLEDADKVLAKLETYVLTPALIFLNWAGNCTPKSLIENSNLILYGLILIVIYDNDFNVIFCYNDTADVSSVCRCGANTYY